MKFIFRFHRVLLALLFVVALFVPQQPAGANSYYGSNWKLTFYSPVGQGDTAQEIYTVNPDGSALTRITNDNTQQANPQWSPNTSSRKMAFDQVDSGEGRNLYIQNITSAGAASGSPSVVSGADTCENEWDPSWSPDESTLAFHRTSTVRGDCGVGNALGPNHIFTIDASGGTPVARTGNASSGVCDGDCDAEDAATRDTEPAWNKDGDTLVFTRADTSDDSTQIATVPANGDEDDVEIINGSDGGSSPQWSPTTDTIVFSKGGEIWTYTVGDTEAEALTTGATNVSAPTYSPDGVGIAATGDTGISYYVAATGVHSITLAIDSDATLDFDAANGPFEIDWARTSTPPNSVHECTTYVNESCDDSEFAPSIPDVCATGHFSAFVSTSPTQGDASYSDGAYTYQPDEGYVGEDSYVYTYYDEYYNEITCTVNITVLPRPPATGTDGKPHAPFVLGAIGASLVLYGVYFFKRRNA